MRLITAAEVERLLPMPAAIAAMRSAMVQVSRGETMLPLRQFMAIPGAPGKMAVMPGHIAHPPRFGIKTVSKFSNAAQSHVGTVQLYDATDGTLLSIIEGGTLTAIRTAAASALATDALARADSHSLAILGTGEQARRHAEAIAAVRPLTDIRVWGRSLANAEALARRLGPHVRAVETVDEAVAGADIVCTTTPSAVPILFGADIGPGVHLNLVGSAIPSTAEVDSTLVAKARFYGDFAEATRAQAGELRAAIADGSVGEDHLLGEIGAVLLGTLEGRRSDNDITIYKSLGVTAQDLAAADAVLEAAIAAGLGLDIALA
ncbi:ornithine cyclodeaminase family protein [Polymorphobacter sp.]|uniref:ornithine cyclodeaminase family protein n=1 Tax=Polymorphobacter sp. TaxID=1909290 RepID=UPI003F70F621